MNDTPFKEHIREHARTFGGCKQIVRDMPEETLKHLMPYPIAILSNFTVQGLEDCVRARGIMHDLNVQIYNGEYGQWQQEIAGTALYEHNPKTIFLLLDWLGPEQYIHYTYAENESGATSFFDMQRDILHNAIESIKEKTSAHIVITNFVQPKHTHRGLADQKMENGMRESILRANLSLLETYKNDSQVSICDLDHWFATYGKHNIAYNKYYMLADMHVEPHLLPELAEELLGHIIASIGKTKKCLVLDCDNTLWGGVIGEDGIQGIALSPTGRGMPFYLFQKSILSLHKRGILLALNSKNNEADVMDVLQNHPHMIIKPEHIAAHRINWNHKCDNIRDIAQELNIGLDSLVFVDDDKTQRALMRGLVPEVDVLELPDDPLRFQDTLLSYKGFETLSITDEDKKRGAMYTAQRQRNEITKTKTNIEDILRALNMNLRIEKINNITLARAAQLTQKTNQFNLTTQRYSEDDITHILNHNGMAWTLDVSDTYGEYGTTGLIIIRPRNNTWHIDTLLMSCRILGKMIEHQFVGTVLQNLMTEQPKVETITAEYIKTPKNEQTKTFFESCGFTITEEHEDHKTYICDMKQYVFNPSTLMTITYE